MAPPFGPDDAEYALTNALYCNPERVEACAAAGLERADFAVPYCGAAWQTLTRLRAEGQPAHKLTVRAGMLSLGVLPTAEIRAWFEQDYDLSDISQAFDDQIWQWNLRRILEAGTRRRCAAALAGVHLQTFGDDADYYDALDTGLGEVARLRDRLDLTCAAPDRDPLGELLRGRRSA